MKRKVLEAEQAACWGPGVFPTWADSASWDVVGCSSPLKVVSLRLLVRAWNWHQVDSESLREMGTGGLTLDCPESLATPLMGWPPAEAQAAG